MEECRGRIYRFRVSQYVDGRGVFVRREKFVPMKRLSCPGCDRCFWVDECEVRDMHNEMYTVWSDCLQVGDLVELSVTNVSRDWETGIVDDWDYEFVRNERGDGE